MVKEMVQMRKQILPRPCGYGGGDCSTTVKFGCARSLRSFFLPLIRSTVIVTRTCPGPLYQFLMLKLVGWLELRGEKKCGDNILKHYTNDDREALDCSFRIAPDRIQPGSGCGSQS